MYSLKQAASVIAISVCLGGMAATVFAQQRGNAAATPAPAPTLPGPDDPIKIMVDRLELEKYKATIKGTEPGSEVIESRRG